MYENAIKLPLCAYRLDCLYAVTQIVKCCFFLPETQLYIYIIALNITESDQDSRLTVPEMNPESSSPFCH